jgi:Ca2+-binding RTX toxin-like protein
MLGTALDDYLFGGTGNDVLDAGAGTGANLQHLRGEAGDDTYLIGSDAGNLHINYLEGENDGNDTVRFKDLLLDDVTFSVMDYTAVDPDHVAGEQLRISWNSGGASGQVRIDHMGQYIERFEFADGTVLEKIEVRTDGRYHLHGLDSGAVVTGTDNDDYIFGGANDDVLDAGGTAGGWQHLFGYGGDDLFLYGKESGNVLVNYHEGEGDGTADTVRFKDLTLSDVTIGTYQYTTGSNGLALSFQWTDGANSGELRVANEGQYIERFEFADGTYLSKIEIDGIGRANLYGTEAADYIRASALSTGGENGRYADDNVVWAGAGNDVLETGSSDWADYQVLGGQAGDDTYLIGSDSGSVIIDYRSEISGGGTDAVRFKDLNLSDLTVSTYDHGNANGESLVLAWEAEGARPKGQFYVANGGQHIERFEFADGTSLSTINVQADGSIELIGTSANDRISGTMAVDHLTGGAGSDTFVFTDGHGNDTVTDFTDGDDLILIEGGTFSFADLVLETSGDDALVQFGSTVITLEGVLVSDLDQSDFLFV